MSNYISIHTGTQIDDAVTKVNADNLVANKAIITNSSNKLASSSITDTELSYLSGVSGAIQTQINNKLNSSSYTANDVLSKLLTVDGTGSGLDAEYFQGSTPLAFASSGHTHSNYEPTLTKGNLSGTTSQILVTGGTNAVIGSGASISLASTPIIEGLEISSTTINTVPIINTLKQIASSAVSSTELGYLSGVTSSIQNQINKIGTYKVVASSGGDYTTLSAAIAANETRIYIKAGTYNEGTNKIEIRNNNTYILGENKENTIINFTGNGELRLYANNCIINGIQSVAVNGAAFVIGDGSVTATPLTSVGCNNIIDNCKFIGGSTIYAFYIAGASYERYGKTLDAYNSKDLQTDNIVSNCYMESSYIGDGFTACLQKNFKFINNTCKGARLSFYMNRESYCENNKFIDSNGVGLYLAGVGNNNNINHNLIVNAQTIGIKSKNESEHDPLYAGMGFSNNNITHNIVYGTGLIGISIEGVSANITKYNNISNNIIKNAGDSGIYLLYADYNNISNNIIDTPKYDLANTRGSGIYIVIANYNKIKNNLVIDTRAAGSGCSGGIIDRENTGNIGNIIEDNGLYCINNERTIWIQGDYTIVKNNYLIGGYYAGIQLKGADHCIVQNNTCKNNTNNANNTFGEIWLTDSADYNIIKYNHLESTATNKAKIDVFDESGSSNNTFGFNTNFGCLTTHVDNIILENSAAYQIKNSSGTAKNAVKMTTGNVLEIGDTSGSINIPSLTASTVPYLDSSKNITSSSVSNTELGYLSGVTSGIQSQFNKTLEEVDTVANVKLKGIANNRNVYCRATNTIYTYLASGASYVANDFNILTTADGGNTRWIAIQDMLYTNLQTATYSGTGFLSRTTTSMSIVGQNFTIAPTGSSFDIYINGNKHVKTSSSVTLPLTVGMHYIYFDTSATLVSSMTPWEIPSSKVFVAGAYCNGNEYTILDERHGANRNMEWHRWAHYTIGARFETGLVGTFSTSATSFTSGKIHDEDIANVIPSQSGNCVLMWYRNPTNFYFAATPIAVTANIVAGALKYDNAGTLTSVSNNQYTTNFIYATNDITNPIYMVTGQASYSSQANAEAATLPDFANFPSMEMKLIYAVVWRNASGTPTYISNKDYRFSAGLPGGGTTVTNASSVAYIPYSTISSTNVQAAIQELTDESVTSSSVSSVDNSIVRMDSTTGKIIQTSLVTIDDTGSINIPTGQTYKINGTALAQANITGITTTDSPQFAGLSLVKNADASLSLNMTNSNAGTSSKSIIDLSNGTNNFIFEKFSTGNSSLNKISTSAGDFEVNVISASNFYIKTNNSTAFLIDSTNKSYLYNDLLIQRTATGAGLQLTVENLASTGDSFALMQFKSNVTKLQFFSGASSYSGTYYGLNYANLNYIISDTNASNFLIAQDGTGSIQFGTNGSVRLTIDSTGNSSFTGSLGIGISPSVNYGIYIARDLNNTNGIYGIGINDTSSTTATGSYTKYAISYNNTLSYVASGQTNSGTWYGVNLSNYINTATHQGTLSDQIGIFIKTGINSCGTGGIVTNTYGISSIIYCKDADATITNAYIYHGTYDHTLGTLTNKWGLYLTGESKNSISGNLNIGSGTLSSWSTSYRALEFYASALYANNSNTSVALVSNTYYDGSFKYKTTAATAYYSIGSGIHTWGYAASGTAGDSFTFSTLMASDLNGCIGLGASPSANYRLNIEYNTTDTDTKYAIATGVVNTSTVNGTYTTGGAYFQSRVVVPTGVINSGSVFGIRSEALAKASTHQGIIANLYGSYTKAGLNGCGVGGAATNVYGILSEVDRTDVDGTITNGYAVYGGYTGTSGTVTNRWGLYVTGEEKNYLSGNLYIGSSSYSAWGSSYRAIEFYGSAILATNNNFATYITSNAYYDGANYKAKHTSSGTPSVLTNHNGYLLHEYAQTNVTAGDTLTLTQGFKTDKGYASFGISAPSSFYKIRIEKSETDMSTNASIVANTTQTLTTSATRNTYGAQFNSNTIVPTGVTNSGFNLGVGGYSAIGTAASQGTLTTNIGGWFETGISSCLAGYITTDTFGVKSTIYRNDADGTMTNAYLFYGNYSGSSSPITNSPYGIYITGESLNYLSGVLGIGVAPNANYNLYISRTLNDTSGVEGIYINNTSSVTLSTGSYSTYGFDYNNRNSYIASGLTNNSGNGWTGAYITNYISTTNHQGTLDNQNGVWSLIGIDSCGTGGTITNSYSIKSGIRCKDADATITNAYLYHGSYDHTLGTVTNKWGLYLSGESKNYISGNLSIGTTGSTWHTNYRTIEFYASSVVGRTDDDVLNLFNNLTSSDNINFTYKITGAASAITLNNGSFIYSTASSGTSGNTATLYTALSIANTGTITSNTIAGTGNALTLNTTDTSGAGHTCLIQGKNNGTTIWYVGCGSTANNNLQILNADAAGDIRFLTNNSSVPKMIIDVNGNIGIGTTDIEAWDSPLDVIEFYRSAIFASNVSEALYIGSNNYNDGAWKYKSADKASLITLNNGTCVISVTDTTGTVDGAITWTDALTVASTGAITTTSTLVTGGKITTSSTGKDGLITQDSTAYATGVGGGIYFQGKYTSGGSYSTGASIATYKENATDGNYNFGLEFNTRANGAGSVARALILNSDTTATFSNSIRCLNTYGLTIQDSGAVNRNAISLTSGNVLTIGSASTTLRFDASTAVATETVTSDRTLTVNINGTSYKILLKV